MCELTSSVYFVVFIISVQPKIQLNVTKGPYKEYQLVYINCTINRVYPAILTSSFNLIFTNNAEYIGPTNIDSIGKAQKLTIEHKFNIKGNIRVN